jgi:hypothetical protein
MPSLQRIARLLFASIRPLIASLPVPSSSRRWATAAMAGAVLLASCSDNQVIGKGGSSGVDNPEITVAFFDAAGKALRVTGDLNIYAADQNPAVDATPLITRTLKSYALIKLDGNSFENLMAAASKSTSLSKTSGASAAGRAAGDAAGTFLKNIDNNHPQKNN